MQKTGIVIKTQKLLRSGHQIVTVMLDNSESALCSIKATDPRTSCGCGCSGGCSGCGAAQETGLFAVQGNIIRALNTTGTLLPLGKKITVEISSKKALLQAGSAIGIPFLLSIFFYIIFFMKSQSENTALQGLFLGFALGIGCAFCINRITKERALPEVIDFSAP